MSYQIVAISNEKGAPEQAYNKLERAGACPDANYAGEKVPFPFVLFFKAFLSLLDETHSNHHILVPAAIVKCRFRERGLTSRICVKLCSH